MAGRPHTRFTPRSRILFRTLTSPKVMTPRLMLYLAAGRTSVSSILRPSPGLHLARAIACVLGFTLSARAAAFGAESRAREVGTPR